MTISIESNLIVNKLIAAMETQSYVKIEFNVTDEITCRINISQKIEYKNFLIVNVTDKIGKPHVVLITDIFNIT